MLNGLDLFSGIGGLTLALRPWVWPVAYCECEKYTQAVLLSRMHNGMLPKAPIWSDVRTLGKNGFEGFPEIDIIYGGFPCQDISVAGLGKGLDGERSRIFWEIPRLVGALRPAFVFLENSHGIRTRGLSQIARAFTDLGYDYRWTVVSAAELGAPHRRKRWFFLAHTHETRRGKHQETNKRQERLQGRDSAADSSWWTVEPRVGRVVHELPYRMDRIRGLGNAVVPAQAREAFKRLCGLK